MTLRVAAHNGCVIDGPTLIHRLRPARLEFDHDRAGSAAAARKQRSRQANQEKCRDVGSLDTLHATTAIRIIKFVSQGTALDLGIGLQRSWVHS